MLEKVTGSFIGTGATIYLGLGFIPTYVKMWNMEDISEFDFLMNMRDDLSVDASGGAASDDGVPAAAVQTAGVQPYYGGDVIATVSASYKVVDPLPNKQESTTYGRITKFTVDTPSSYAGHFDLEADDSEIGAGSIVKINDGNGVKSFLIKTLTSNGEGSGEVILDRAVMSGDVTFISGIATYRNAAVGVTMPEGIIVSATPTVNTSGDMTSFIAWH